MSKTKTAAAPAIPELKKEIAVIPPQPIVMLADSIDKIVEQSNLFGVLKAKLLGPNDYMDIGDKRFIKKSGWRKFALAFNISDEILKEERKEYGANYFVWELTVRATAPNGRYSDATASCASNEKRFAHLEHDVRATAATRAKNRAISDLIGGGEVSAEEIEADETTIAPHQNTPVARYNAPQATNTQEPMTDKQRNMIFALLKKMGKSQEWIEERSKKRVETFTKVFATGLIDQMLKKVAEMEANQGLPVVQAGEPADDPNWPPEPSVLNEE